MMTPEETRVLAFLRKHLIARVGDVARACLVGASPEWVDRVIGTLDWFGYVTVFYGPAGEAAVVQITDRGKACRLTDG